MPQTRSQTAKVATKKEWGDNHQLVAWYFNDIAKISTGLLIGVMALETFLLSVGLQHPKVNLRIFFYTAVIGLGVNLFLFALSHSLKMWLMSRSNAKWGTLKWLRVLQQVAFIVSIVAVVAFALAAAQLFFDVTAAASAG